MSPFVVSFELLQLACVGVLLWEAFCTRRMLEGRTQRFIDIEAKIAALHRRLDEVAAGYRYLDKFKAGESQP